MFQLNVMLAVVPWFALVMCVFALRILSRRQKLNQNPTKKSPSSSPTSKMSVSGLRAPPGLLPPKFPPPPAAALDKEAAKDEVFGSKLRAARQSGAAKKLPTTTIRSTLVPAAKPKPAATKITDWDAYLEAKAPGVLQAKYQQIQTVIAKKQEDAPTKMTLAMERFLEQKREVLQPNFEPDAEPPSKSSSSDDLMMTPSKEIQQIWNFDDMKSSFPVLDSWAKDDTSPVRSSPTDLDPFLPPQGNRVPELEFGLNKEAMDTAEEQYWEAKQAKGKGKGMKAAPTTMYRAPEVAPHSEWDDWWGPEDSHGWDEGWGQDGWWGEEGWGENYWGEAPRKARRAPDRTPQTVYQKPSGRTPDWNTPQTSYRAPDVPAETPDTTYRTPEVKVWQHTKGRGPVGKGKPTYVWVEKGAAGEQSSTAASATSSWDYE